MEEVRELLNIFKRFFLLINMSYIYVIKLAYGKYYVGKTTNPRYRLDDHFSENGSLWTQKYKPFKVVELFKSNNSMDEDNTTIKYMKDYGINNVRGGSFTSLTLNTAVKETITKMIDTSENRCFKCNKVGHFASECKMENYKKNYELPKKTDDFKKKIYKKK